MEEMDKTPSEEETTASGETLEQPEAVEPSPAVEETSAPSGTAPEIEPIDVGGTAQDAEPAEVFVPEEALAPTKTRGGRFKDAIRKGFIWLLVFAFIYLAGVVTMYVLEVQPGKDALEQTQQELDQATQDVADLQFELDQAYVDLGYNAYLQVVADVYGARLALLEGDTALAKNFLADAELNLEYIYEDVATFDQNLADSLTQRLDLVITNVDSDIERSLQDAEVLSEDLEKVPAGAYGID